MFIPQPYHLRALWWKFHPPPIKSPFLHHPRYAKEAARVLATLAQHKQRPIEFGCLYGWTTDIIVRNIPWNVKLKSYDTFAQVPVEKVKANVNSDKVIFIYMNIWHWLRKPEFFDFLYIDAHNTELLIKEVWSATQDQISIGSVVLFEGATRMRLNIPHKKIILHNPGLGQLLP